MSAAYLRHPRYVVLILVALVFTLYLVGPFDAPPPPVHVHEHIEDPDLPRRIAESERIYSKVLHERQALIQKFGPRPSDISLFPANKDPWPAYTVWSFFPAAFNCPHEIQRLGALGDGGKWVCGITRLETKPNCVIYSFGNNHESSFEADILANTEHCEVWGYDFSVKSFGPEIRPYAKRAHFRQYGLAERNAHGPGDHLKLYTLETLMELNGHTHIDFLKIDIERWEFDTMAALLKPYLSSGKPLPFGQLSMEIHLWGMSFTDFLSWWETLEHAGLRPFWSEPNLIYTNYNRGSSSELASYTFLNIKGDNIFITDPLPVAGDT